MSISDAERPHDVVLYGATGFTGRQTAAYFQQHAPPGLRWAIAGRTASKLQQLHASLGLGPDVAVVIADSGDQSAVNTMAADTRVLLTTAGPFARYGDSVVQACVENHTHYVDITGETQWVRRMIDRWHDKASADGTRIVPFCGFDSIPSDLGVWMVAQWLREHGHGGIRSVRATFKLGGGGLNGGTLAAGLHAGEMGQQSMVGSVLLLNPSDRQSAEEATRSADWSGVSYDEQLRCYLAPFVMAPVNTRVVRRSNALLAADGEAYGEAFAYTECLETSRRAMAWATHLGTAAAQSLLLKGWGRAILRRVGPAPGSGPSEAKMNDGWFRTRLLAEAEDGTRALGIVKGRGDAGNRSTVRMLCESAFVLALDGDELPGGPGLGGVLTPATALGGPLLKRLRATPEMSWEVAEFDS